MQYELVNILIGVGGSFNIFVKHWGDGLSDFFTSTCNSVLAHRDDTYSW